MLTRMITRTKGRREGSATKVRSRNFRSATQLPLCQILGESFEFFFTQSAAEITNGAEWTCSQEIGLQRQTPELHLSMPSVFPLAAINGFDALKACAP